MSILVIRGLTKRYGDVIAVRDASLAAGAGEIVALVGPNGAGKSTVLKTIPGLIRPTAGRVDVLGHAVGTDPLVVRRLVGYVPQRLAFTDARPAEHVVAHYAALRGAADRSARNLLSEVGLARAADRPARAFSGGMMQRLGLAIALLGAPPLLVLDEPMVSLDPDGSAIVRETLRAHRARGGAALIATHILSDAEMLSDRVCLLANGRILADDTVPALVQRFAPELEADLDTWRPGPGPLETVYREAFRAAGVES